MSASAVMLLLALQASAPDWTADIDPSGWSVGGRGVETRQFFRPGRAPNLLWVRYESKQAHPFGEISRLSTVQLFELDCKTGRVKELQSIGYTGRNMTGVAFEAPQIDGTWSYPVPQTMKERALDFGCTAR